MSDTNDPENTPTENSAAKAQRPPKATEFARARAQFRTLLLANPNYFGNLKVSAFTPVLPLQEDTTFEEIGCVGFQPQFNRLDAVVFVKQPAGYGGDVCSNGTPEYVRFFLSFDNGATWQDQGLTSFMAFDVPTTVTDGRRLEYAVSLQVNPPKRFCFIDNVVLARAILSWNVPPPPDPNFTPIWGNVHNTHILVDPLRLYQIGSLFQELKIKTPPELSAVLDLSQPVAAAAPEPLSAAALQALYKDKGVEPHRFALTEVQKLIAQPALSASLMEPGFSGVLSGLNIDLGAIVGKLFPTDGDTRYEELECVGLNPNQDTLVGTIRTKLPSGYSGDPCTAGSREYVTFWGDFDNNGTFETCLGSTSVTVHDIDAMPKEGLEYSVFLPVDLDKYRQPCKAGPRVARIRAILSWQVAPPCGNPNFIPIWGNREETLIQIRPGPQVGDTQVPFLSAVGNILESFVDGNGLIIDAVALQTGAHFVDAPFGGRITIAGHISNATPGMLYRVRRKPHGAADTAYVPLTNEPDGLVLGLNTFNGVSWQQTNITLHADANGYYPFEDYSSNHSIDNNIMGVWFSTAAEDAHAYDLRIDLRVDGNPANDVHSNVVTVLIDNTEPHVELDIDLGGGAQCADFDQGVTFTGHYTATDTHFGAFSFEIEPSGPPDNPPHGVLPAPPAGSHGITSAPGLSLIPDPGIVGGIYTLNTGINAGPPPTGPMEACGYALILHVWDRANVNSGQRNNNSKASVGFCLRMPTE